MIYYQEIPNFEYDRLYFVSDELITWKEIKREGVNSKVFYVNDEQILTKFDSETSLFCVEMVEELVISVNQINLNSVVFEFSACMSEDFG